MTDLQNKTVLENRMKFWRDCGPIGLRTAGVAALALVVFTAGHGSAALAGDNPILDILSGAQSNTGSEKSYVGGPGGYNQSSGQNMAAKFPVPPPAGVGGVYVFPKPGKTKLRYTYTRVEVDGMIQGSKAVSPETVAATVKNRFFGLPKQPPFLRVVPDHVDVNIHVLGGLHSLTRNVSIVGAIPFIEKTNRTITFKGATGTTRLGTSVNTTKGIGDVKLGGLFRVYDDSVNHFLLNAVLSMPTGSIKQIGTTLTPTGAYKTSRIGYGMQLGSGTWDPILGMSYWGRKGRFGWGAQYLGTFRVQGSNSQHYRLGNKHTTTAWVSVKANKFLTASVRLKGEIEDKIHGMDPNILGAGLAANTDNYGGERLELFVGGNLTPWKGSNLSFEVGKPVYQNRNGVQGKKDYMAHITFRTALPSW